LAVHRDAVERSRVVHPPELRAEDNGAIGGTVAGRQEGSFESVESVIEAAAERRHSRPGRGQEATDTAWGGGEGLDVTLAAST
jgi:hypothetical protein